VEVTLRISCEGCFRKAAREVKAPIARSHCQSRPNRGLHRTSFCLILRPFVRADQLNLFEKKLFPCFAYLSRPSSKVHRETKGSAIDCRRVPDIRWHSVENVRACRRDAEMRETLKPRRYTNTQGKESKNTKKRIIRRYAACPRVRAFAFARLLPLNFRP